MSEFLQQAWRTLQARILSSKARCYQRVFDLAGDNAHEAERVLGDLRRFCRANQSTFDTEAAQAARLAGRREVWLRIANFLDLTDAQVRNLLEVEDDYAGE